MVSSTREGPAPSSSLFLHGPDVALHVHRAVQKRPFPLQGHLCALWHVDLHWKNYNTPLNKILYMH